MLITFTIIFITVCFFLVLFLIFSSFAFTFFLLLHVLLISPMLLAEKDNLDVDDNDDVRLKPVQPVLCVTLQTQIETHLVIND